MTEREGSGCAGRSLAPLACREAARGEPAVALRLGAAKPGPEPQSCRAEGNIGYNVNSNPNGVWSPGNYGVRPWGDGGKAFENAAHGVTAKDFAFAAIEAWGCQFHDAHEKYSGFVSGVLEKISDKLRANETLWCPKQQKEAKDKKPQLFALVGRLNTVSTRMKRMLVFPTSGWKSNVYTSRFVEQYMSEKDHQLRGTDQTNRS